MVRSARGEGTRPRICFVAHNAYRAASRPGADFFIGGVEWQQTLMSCWLARRGYPVSLITWDEAQPDDIEVEGVRILKVCRRDQGWRGLRFFHPRWTSLVRALRKADADLYYHNCAEYVTGQVALWTRWHSRRFVYSVASEPDCDPRLPALKTLRERVLYRYGVRHADRIVVQTQRQQAMLREGFGLSSIVLPMPCPDPWNGPSRLPERPTPTEARVLWAGRINPVKRLELLLEVAAILPHVAFEVAGAANRDMPYAREVEERARSMSNVTLLGRVPRERMPELYERAVCLLCTSHYEGLPNTFLEAWSHGLPVVSTVDPDRVIEAKDVGVVATGAAGLARGIRELLASPRRWLQASQNARRHFVENHSVEAAMSRFERFFLEVLVA